MTIWLTIAVERHLVASAEDLAPLETGGMLLGWRDGTHRIVTDVIGPGDRALHGRYAFVPDHGWQKQQLESAFQGSEGDLDYLGDWHTHPGGPAEMSAIDHATLRRIGRKVPGALTLIAAADRDTCWTMKAWAHRRTGFLRSLAEPRALRTFEKPSGWPGL